MTGFAKLYKTDTSDNAENELRDIIKDGICKRIEDNLKVYEIKCNNKFDMIVFLTNLEKDYNDKIYNKYINYLFNQEMLIYLTSVNGIYQIKSEFAKIIHRKYKLFWDDIFC